MYCDFCAPPRVYLHRYRVDQWLGKNFTVLDKSQHDILVPTLNLVLIYQGVLTCQIVVPYCQRYDTSELGSFGTSCG